LAASVLTSNGVTGVSDEPKPREKTQQDAPKTKPGDGMPGPRGRLDQQDQRGTGGKPRDKDKIAGSGAKPQPKRVETN
jgi:hypothetical protein